MRFGWPDALRGDNPLPFQHGIELIRGHSRQILYLSRWPANFDAVDFLRCANAKVHAQVVLRQIAAAAVNLFGLGHAPGDNFNARVERQAIALGPGQFKTNPVVSWNAVIAQNHRGAIDIADDHVHVAVIKEVAYGEAAGDALLQQRRSGLRAGIAKRAVALIELQQFWLAITGARRERVHLRVDVTAYRN